MLILETRYERLGRYVDIFFLRGGGAIIHEKGVLFTLKLNLFSFSRRIWFCIETKLPFLLVTLES